MMKFLLPLSLLCLTVATSLPADNYVAPVWIDDEVQKPAVFAVYTEDHQHMCAIHVALFEDGVLMWTDGYRTMQGPQDLEQSEVDLSCTYDVNTITIDPMIGNSLLNEVIAYQQPSEFSSGEFGVPFGFPYNTIFVKTEETEIIMHNNPYYNNVELQRLFNPDATPVPLTPEQEAFQQDWDYVKDLLFDLVDEYKDSPEKTVRHLTFNELVVADQTTSPTTTQQD